MSQTNECKKDNSLKKNYNSNPWIGYVQFFYTWKMSLGPEWKNGIMPFKRLEMNIDIKRTNSDIFPFAETLEIALKWAGA